MAAGDVNDLWARALTRSLVKFIPGSPSVVAQNMAGGGSMIAANYLYRIPKPDGLTIGQISAGLYFQQLTEPTRGPIRLAQVQLDRRRGQSRGVADDAHRHAVQIHRRYPRRQRAAQVFRHGAGIERAY
jgi:hypothetical protein